MAAVVDLDINEGDTFIMTLEFWSNDDGTIPMDITADTFTGAFQIGNKYIPMSLSILSLNVIEAKVDYTQMGSLSNKGKYDIDQEKDGDKFRLMQGAVTVSQEVTK